MKFLISNTAANVFTIDIDGEIGILNEDAFSFSELKEKLNEINQLQNPLLRINIRSTGGDVNDALLIYDALCELSEVEIVTCCYGYVASAATIIAQAASEGNREISQNALYLIHKAMCHGEGNSNNLTSLLELLDKTDQRIASIYAQRSGKPQDEFIELMNKNNGDGLWLTSTEALEAGLVDKINTIGEQSNSNTEEIMNFSKQWSSILKKLGIEKTSNKMILNDDSLAEIENKITAQNQKNDDLEKKVITLEAENKRLNALATKTLQVEDAASRELLLSQNQKAYSADIANFK
ncbi:MAG: Clp protease ClpP [Rikenellaceae bacterium]